MCLSAFLKQQKLLIYMMKGVSVCVSKAARSTDLHDEGCVCAYKQQELLIYMMKGVCAFLKSKKH